MAYWKPHHSIAGRISRNVDPIPAPISATRSNSRRPIPQQPLTNLPRCPEIDCIRHLLPPGAIALAELRAKEVGLGADRVLIAAGTISEATYVAALAKHLNMAFEPLEHRPRAQCPLSNERMIEAATTGILPIADDGGTSFVIAPSLVNSRRLVALATSDTDLASRIRLTTATCLHDFIARHAAVELTSQACDRLRDIQPNLSAGSRCRLLIPVAACASVVALASILATEMTLVWLEVILGFVFLAWIALRLLGLLSEPLVKHKQRVFTDSALPIYSIVIALYREGPTVEHLVAALRRLDYPMEKLDIKLVLEPDDHETLAAVARLRLRPPFEVVLAPHAGPRTKPKALNSAMPFVRGAFLAVFDAEDRPKPNQLRCALETFFTADEGLACVQARLTIDNTGDGWITRMFTAEYSGLFDVLLPGLAAWRLPLPLGGSSNHFRTNILRRVGAWDPYNVTEDADLGMRLARFGYRTTVISSSTYEEAPSELGPWVRQRTRWFKGWIQTWLVHMRAPRTLANELGLPGFATFQLIVGGSVLAALVHPIFAIELVRTGVIMALNDRAVPDLLWFHIAVLVSGYGISAALAVIGLSRRGLLHCSWSLLLMPIYWILLSLAAWRALIQFAHAPYRWEKTEHGLARSSRLEQFRFERQDWERPRADHQSRPWQSTSPSTLPAAWPSAWSRHGQAFIVIR